MSFNTTFFIAYGVVVKRRIANSTDDTAIVQYIKKHGFGSKTPLLSKTLPAKVFRQHYYDKKELMDFCRSIGISTSGLKEDLNKRIELYLQTEKITVIETIKKSTKSDSQAGLTLDKFVVNYKSDLATRRFFERHIPQFTGFSALVQKQIRQRLAQGDTFTYGDVIEMHKEFLQNKKEMKNSNEEHKVAHDSCQYNQFFIDFSRDSGHKLHSAIEAWMLVRNSAGAKTYQSYKDKIEKIRSILKIQEESKVP